MSGHEARRTERPAGRTNAHADAEEHPGEPRNHEDLWQRVSALVANRHPDATADGPRSLRFVLATREAAPTRIGLRLHGTEAYGEPVVVVAADLGPATRIDAEAALAINCVLVHGALAVADGVLYLRTVIASSHDHADAVLERRIHLLAVEAAELKRRLVAPRIDPAVFAHVVE